MGMDVVIVMSGNFGISLAQIVVHFSCLCDEWTLLFGGKNFLM